MTVADTSIKTISSQINALPIGCRDQLLFEGAFSANLPVPELLLSAAPGDHFGLFRDPCG